MPNHVHMLVIVNETLTLSKIEPMLISIFISIIEKEPQRR
jgi:REP element-mobilizing transposase RayT